MQYSLGSEICTQMENRLCQTLFNVNTEISVISIYDLVQISATNS